MSKFAQSLFLSFYHGHMYYKSPEIELNMVTALQNRQGLFICFEIKTNGIKTNFTDCFSIYKMEYFG